jgi:hypothetical protein
VRPAQESKPRVPSLANSSVPSPSFFQPARHIVVNEEGLLHLTDQDVQDTLDHMSFHVRADGGTKFLPCFGWIPQQKPPFRPGFLIQIRLDARQPTNLRICSFRPIEGGPK